MVGIRYFIFAVVLFCVGCDITTTPCCSLTPATAVIPVEVDWSDSGFDVTATKATSTTRADAIDIYSGFGVYATFGDGAESYDIPEGVYKSADSGVSWTWDGTTYYWPDSSSDFPVTFYAYAPYGSSAFSLNVTEDPDDGITSDITIQSADSQVDIVSAVNSASSTPVGGKISLEFQHILTRLLLDINSSTGSTLYIQSVDFSDLMGTNTYDFVGQSWSDVSDYTTVDTSSSYAYYELTQGDAYELLEGEQGESGSGSSYFDGTYDNLILMPQTCQPWKLSSPIEGARVEIVFRAVDSSTGDDHLGYSATSDYPDYSSIDSSVSSSSPLFIKVGLPLSEQWEAGKSITYTLTLGGYGTNNGYFLSEYYYDEDGNETLLPIDEAVVGSPVTNDEICFSVTVKSWGAGNTVTLN